jgi:hypothetical protein
MHLESASLSLMHLEFLSHSLSLWRRCDCIGWESSDAPRFSLSPPSSSSSLSLPLSPHDRYTQSDEVFIFLIKRL